MLATLSRGFRRELGCIFQEGSRWKYAPRLCQLMDAIASERSARVAGLMLSISNDLVVYRNDSAILCVFDEYGMWRIFQQAALYRSTKRSLTPDWQIRYAALLFMRDWRLSVDAFDAFLLHVRVEGSRKLVLLHNSAPGVDPISSLACGGGRLDDRMLHLQCGAAVLAGDVVWLTTAAPQRRRPRHFFPSAAPETPHVPSDSSD
jgi:hypothetical protein